MKKKFYQKTLSLLTLTSALSMYSCQQDENPAQPLSNLSASVDASTAANKNFIEDQYIVIFKDSNKKASELVADLIMNGRIKSEDVKDEIEGKIRGFSARLTTDQLSKLKKQPFVDYIEQDQVVSNVEPALDETSLPDSTSVVTSSEIIPTGVQLVGHGDGTGKTVWVIDSGIDVNNPELNVDVTRSKSFLTTTTSIQDVAGHGTMVAGVIAAKNNGTGIVGVAANATIVALRVMDDAGNGTVTTLIKAVNHINANAKAGDVVNISIASGISTTLDNAVKTAAAKGIFFAIAAGNSAIDCSTKSPQRVNANNVYTVSAMDYNHNFYISSNFGASVDYTAPGVNILTLKVGGGTTSGTGTSFAAPHVAGLLLLKGNAITNIGYVTGDLDSTPDPIAHL